MAYAINGVPIQCHAELMGGPECKEYGNAHTVYIKGLVNPYFFCDKHYKQYKGIKEKVWVVIDCDDRGIRIIEVFDSEQKANDYNKTRNYYVEEVEVK